MRIGASSFVFLLLLATSAVAQTDGLKPRSDVPPRPGDYTVQAGTRVLMTMVNGVSTKTAQPGDRLYLRTSFPVTVEGHIIIPENSYVTGTVTEAKRPGRVHGRGELQVRFDSIMLPNGTTYDLRSDLAAVDGTTDQKVDHERSSVKSPGGAGSDAAKILIPTASGAGAGAGIGSVTRHAVRGGLIGSGIGAAAGLATVLATRGPDATLPKGSSVEMVLDRTLTFREPDAAPERPAGGFKRVEP